MLMLKSAQKNKIPSVGLFYILFICRIVVSLTSVHSVSTTVINSQALISYVIAMLFTLILSIPVIFCYKLNKNPIEIKWLSKLYCIYFLITAAVSVSRFSYFASTTLNPETQGWIFAFIICVCAFYGASLGIEALSRFSAFAFVLLALAIVSVLLCNINTFNDVNFYPIITSGKNDVFKNALVFSSNTSELAAFLVLFPKVRGKCVKTYVRFICFSFLSVFILLYFSVAVMGDGVSIRNFPFYSFFQVSKFGDFERLDVLHISFWIMGVFVKAVTYLYSACSCVASKPGRKQTALAATAVFVLSVFMLKFTQGQGMNLTASIALFFAFCIFAPVATLIFKKKDNGDELVKMF